MSISATKPLIIGHRGNPGNPLNSLNIENTERSFQSAWDVGVDGVEFDVELSKDGVLFVHHDDNFGRVFVAPDKSKKKLVSSYTWDAISRAKLNVKGLKKNVGEVHVANINGQAGATIPRLEEIPVSSNGLLFLEIKLPKDIEPQSQREAEYLDELVRLTVKSLEENKLIDRTVILSFVASALAKAKLHNLNLKTAFNIYQHEAEGDNFDEFLRTAKRDFGIDAVNPPFEQTSKTSITTAHDLGLFICPWVWNEPALQEIAEIKRLLSIGVDGVITNQPGEAVLNRYN